MTTSRSKVHSGRTMNVVLSDQHLHEFDVYSITHRSGIYRYVRATGINDARQWAASNFGWKQLDMHARIIEISNVSTKSRHTGLMFWLRDALPFNLWR